MKDTKGLLAGVPYGLRAKERSLRLTYLAPRVVALLRASRGALEPLVLETYDVAIGADHKAHGSVHKAVLKAQYASLVNRIAAVEMDADDARDAVDTDLAAANEAAAQLAAERRLRAAEVNTRVGARSDRAREHTRAAVGKEIARAAKRLRKEQAATAGLRASGASKDRRLSALRGSTPAALFAAQKERARLNHRIKQPERDVDEARRDAAAAQAAAAAARADGAADRAKIDSLRIPKATLPHEHTHARATRRGAVPPLGLFAMLGFDAQCPLNQRSRERLPRAPARLRALSLAHTRA